MLPMILYRIKDRFHHIGVSWDKLAPTMEQAIDFAHEHINQDPERMIDIHHYSMEYCLAHSGESINERYRHNRTDAVDIKIADMVNKHSTDTDLVLYRGVCDYVFSLMEENAKGHPNCDLLEKGFLATSLVKDHELHYKKRLRIFIPKKSHVVYQGNINDEQNYYEVDVQHGARLKIISADDTYINCKLIATS